MEKDVKINIYLIRHEEKPEEGSSLTKKHQRQILFLVKRLLKFNLYKLISSDIPRCKETTK